MNPFLTAAEIAPAYDLKAVTPDDATDLPDGLCRGIFINGAGNVVLITQGGTDVTITPAVGQIHWIKTSRIKATSTTATGIFAVY